MVWKIHLSKAYHASTGKSFAGAARTCPVFVKTSNDQRLATAVKPLQVWGYANATGECPWWSLKLNSNADSNCFPFHADAIIGPSHSPRWILWSVHWTLPSIAKAQYRQPHFGRPAGMQQISALHVVSHIISSNSGRYGRYGWASITTSHPKKDIMHIMPYINMSKHAIHFWPCDLPRTWKRPWLWSWPNWAATSSAASRSQATGAPSKWSGACRQLGRFVRLAPKKMLFGWIFVEIKNHKK